jgi:hypothetical protein
MWDFMKTVFSGPETDELAGTQEISEERKEELLTNLAKGIVDRGLTAPAIFFLESVKPLNFIGSQAMIFFEPIVRTIFPWHQYSEFAVILEERSTLERLLLAIEDAEEERQRREREMRQKTKSTRRRRWFGRQSR